MNLELPPQSGKTPSTEKQAEQMAYYDSILAWWDRAGFNRVQKIEPSFIEKLCIRLTGNPRGIPLELWEDAIKGVTPKDPKKMPQNPKGLICHILGARMPSKISP